MQLRYHEPQFRTTISSGSLLGLAFLVLSQWLPSSSSPYSLSLLPSPLFPRRGLLAVTVVPHPTRQYVSSTLRISLSSLVIMLSAVFGSMFSTIFKRTCKYRRLPILSVVNSLFDSRFDGSECGKIPYSCPC